MRGADPGCRSPCGLLGPDVLSLMVPGGPERRLLAPLGGRRRSGPRVPVGCDGDVGSGLGGAARHRVFCMVLVGAQADVDFEDILDYLSTTRLCAESWIAMQGIVSAPGSSCRPPARRGARQARRSIKSGRNESTCDAAVLATGALAGQRRRSMTPRSDGPACCGATASSDGRAVRAVETAVRRPPGRLDAAVIQWRRRSASSPPMRSSNGRRSWPRPGSRRWTTRRRLLPARPAGSASTLPTRTARAIAGRSMAHDGDRKRSTR